MLERTSRASLEFVHDQRPRAAKLRADPPHHGLRALPQFRGEPERTSEPRPAGGADLAAHERSEMPVDGKSEAGPAIFARGRTIRLLEYLEQPRNLCGIDANSRILNFEPKENRRSAFLQESRSKNDRSPLRELHGIARVVEDQLREPHRIAAKRLGNRRIDVEDDFQSLSLGAIADEIEDPAHEQRIEIEIGLFERQLSGFDLGDVEDVVDDGKKMLGRIRDLAQLFLLVGTMGGAAQQISEPDNRIHRRSDLVAHIREKCALGLRRGLGRLFGGGKLARANGNHPFEIGAVEFQFHFRPPALGDVGGDGPDAADEAASIAQREARGEVGPPRRAIRQDLLPDHRCGLHRHRPIVRQHARCHIGGKQIHHGLADNRRRCGVQCVGVGPVGDEIAAIEVFGIDNGRRVVDHRLQQVSARTHLSFTFLKGVEHVIEGTREFADFVLRVDLRAGAQFTLHGDRPGHLDQGHDGVEEHPLHDDAQQEGSESESHQDDGQCHGVLREATDERRQRHTDLQRSDASPKRHDGLRELGFVRCDGERGAGEIHRA